MQSLLVAAFIFTIIYPKLCFPKPQSVSHFLNPCLPIRWSSSFFLGTPEAHLFFQVLQLWIGRQGPQGLRDPEEGSDGSVVRSGCSVVVGGRRLQIWGSGRSSFPPRELPEQRMLLAMLLWIEARAW